MRKPLLIIFLFLSAFNLNAQEVSNEIKPYLDLITSEGLSSSLYFLTSDQFEGRAAGTAEEKLAAQYLASCYGWMGLPPLKVSENKNPIDNYFQEFQFTRSNTVKNSQNVIAFIEGSDPVLKNEAIILIAHYDHLGKDTTFVGDQIYNGAADDGSGTVALLHMAKSYAEARKNGMGTRRTIIFIHAGAEEQGVQGSHYYVSQNPIWPLDKTAAVINMDGVGGFDIENLPDNKNYIYILKIDSTSSHLYERAKKVNAANNINLDLLYPKNAARFGSDHQPFEAQLVPSIYFSTGLTEHYHKVTDHASTIDYVHMAKIVKLVFGLSWDLANSPKIKSEFDRAQYMANGQYYCEPCGCSKDNVLFSQAGRCDACSMALIPVWRKK